MSEVVANEVLLEYVQAFRETYLGGLGLIPEDKHSRLAHLPYLKGGRATAYLAPRSGVAVEWRPTPGEDEVRRGDLSLSGLMFSGARRWDDKQNGVYLHRAPDASEILNATFEHCTFEDAGVSVGKLGAALLYRCQFIRAAPVVFGHASARVVIFQSLFVSSLDIPHRQVYLADLRGSTSPDDWSEVAGQRDAYITLMQARAELDLEARNKAPWADWPIDRVLVLGDFSKEHRPRLESIAETLESLGYQPVFVDEVENVPDQDLMQKVAFLIGACRFTIMDDSSRGGQLTELPLVRSSFRSAAMLRLEGSHSSAMTKGLTGPGSRMHTLRYRLGTLPVVVREATLRLENDIAAQTRYLDEEYPWRSGDAPGDLPMVGLGPVFRGLPYKRQRQA